MTGQRLPFRRKHIYDELDVGEDNSIINKKYKLVKIINKVTATNQKDDIVNNHSNVDENQW